MSGCDMVTDAVRASAVNGLPPADWASYGARSKCFVQFLQGYNWSVVSPWTLQHEHLHVRFSLDPGSPVFPRSLSKLQHDLRESWRHFLYEGWRSSDRRDAQACAHIPYSSDRCQAARSMAGTSRRLRIVMSGAFISPMRLWVITRDSPDPNTARRPARARTARDASPSCPFCRDSHDTFLHVVRECPARDRYFHRPPAKLRDALCAYLAWPRAHRSPHDINILDHLDRTRNYILNLRWGAGQDTA